MFYSDVDVSCIIPTHIQNSIAGEESDEEMNTDICCICQDTIDKSVLVTAQQVTSVKDTIRLPCSHTFHYDCMKLACINQKQGNHARECALCRMPYQRIGKPMDDVSYQPRFHKLIQQSDNVQFHDLENVDWESVLAGDVLYVKHSVSKRPFPTGIFVKQSNQQATVKFENNSTMRYAKTNLRKVLSLAQTT